MFITKNKFNRWQLSQKCKDLQGNDLKDNAGNQIYANMQVQFKKGYEPQPNELNKYGSFEIKEMWAIDGNNRKHKILLLPNSYTNNQGVNVTQTKLYIGDWEFSNVEEQDEVNVWHDGEIDTTKFGGSTPEPIKPEELPFY